MADSITGADGAAAVGPGFTGVLWDERPAHRLSADLFAGAGTVPQVDAGVAWARVAAEVAAVGVEYRYVLDRLSDVWESTHAVAALSALAGVTDWLTEVAAAAAGVSLRAHGHAAAVAVARLAMPAPVEIDATTAIRDAATSQVATGAAALAPMIAGAAAQAERAQHDQQLRAGRVMAQYEGATGPMVAAGWAPPPAPRIVPEAAAAPAAAPGGEPEASTTEPPAMVVPMGSMAGLLHGIPAARQLKYDPTVVASTQATVAPVEPARAPAPAAAPPPMASLAPSAMMAREEVRDAKTGGPTEVLAGPVVEVADSASPQTWMEVASAPTSVSAPEHRVPVDRPLDPQFLTSPGAGGVSET